MTIDQQIDQLLAEVTLKKELEENGYIHRDSLFTFVLERVVARLAELEVKVKKK